MVNSSYILWLFCVTKVHLQWDPGICNINFIHFISSASKYQQPLNQARTCQPFESSFSPTSAYASDTRVILLIAYYAISRTNYTPFSVENWGKPLVHMAPNMLVPHYRDNIIMIYKYETPKHISTEHHLSTSTTQSYC